MPKIEKRPKKASSLAAKKIKSGKVRRASSAAERMTHQWDLKLYIAGNTPRSIAAFTNLKALCEEHLAGRYRIEIIDLLIKPQLAKGDQILALPTLVRKLPSPIKKLIGDLSDAERVIVGLDIRPTPKR